MCRQLCGSAEGSWGVTEPSWAGLLHSEALQFQTMGSQHFSSAGCTWHHILVWLSQASPRASCGKCFWEQVGWGTQISSCLAYFRHVQKVWTTSVSSVNAPVLEVPALRRCKGISSCPREDAQPVCSNAQWVQPEAGLRELCFCLALPDPCPWESCSWGEGTLLQSCPCCRAVPNKQCHLCATSSWAGRELCLPFMYQEGQSLYGLPFLLNLYIKKASKNAVLRVQLMTL